MPKAAESARVVLSVLCVAALVAAVAYIVCLFLTTPIQVKVTNYDAYRTEALKMIREEAASFFQLGVAVLGALWAAMIVSKDNRLRREDVPEIVMFVATGLLLVGSLYFNWKYGRLLAQLYWDMGPPLSAQAQFADVMNSRYVVVHYRAVQICFYGVLIMSAVCTFSSSMLRRIP